MTWHLFLYWAMFLRLWKEHAAKLLGQEPKNPTKYFKIDESREMVGEEDNFIVNWSLSNTLHKLSRAGIFCSCSNRGFLSLLYGFPHTSCIAFLISFFFLFKCASFSCPTMAFFISCLSVMSKLASSRAFSYK